MFLLLCPDEIFQGPLKSFRTIWLKLSCFFGHEKGESRYPGCPPVSKKRCGWGQGDWKSNLAAKEGSAKDNKPAGDEPFVVSDKHTFPGRNTNRLWLWGIPCCQIGFSKQNKAGHQLPTASENLGERRRWPQRYVKRGCGRQRWPRGHGGGPASTQDENWHPGSGVNLCNRRICIQMKNDRIFLFSTTFNVIRVKLALSASTAHPPPPTPPPTPLPLRRLKNIHYLWSWGTLFAINLHRRSMT